MRSVQINAAIVLCLEHVAESTSPPAIAAADFLFSFLDDREFAVEEVHEITSRVGGILRGIVNRDMLCKGDLPAELTTGLGCSK